MRFASALTRLVPENTAGTRQVPSLIPTVWVVSNAARSDHDRERVSVHGVVWL